MGRGIADTGRHGIAVKSTMLGSPGRAMDDIEEDLKQFNRPSKVMDDDVMDLKVDLKKQAVPKCLPEATTPREARRPEDEWKSEVRFLEEGLSEVQRAAQMVYTENMELRSRIEHLKTLAGKLVNEHAPHLPKELKHEFDELLSSAIPARGAFDPTGGKEGDMEVLTRCAAEGHTYAIRAREIAKAMDRYEQPGASGSSSESEAEPAPECDSNPEAIQKYVPVSESTIWHRTKDVCYELCTGW